MLLLRTAIPALTAYALLTIATSGPVAATCRQALPPDQEAQLIRESGTAFSGKVIQRWGQTSLIEVTEVWVGVVPSRLVTVSDCSSFVECSSGETTTGLTYVFYGLTGGPFYGLQSCVSPAAVDPNVNTFLAPAKAPPNFSFADLGIVAVFVLRTAWWALVLTALAAVTVVWVRKQIWRWNPYRQGISR